MSRFYQDATGKFGQVNSNAGNSIPNIPARLRKNLKTETTTELFHLNFIINVLEGYAETFRESEIHPRIQTSLSKVRDYQHSLRLLIAELEK